MKSLRPMRRREFLERVAVPEPSRSPGFSRSSFAAVEVDRDELLELATALCRIPSFTTEESDCARFLDEHFQKLGFESELQEVDPGRFQCVARLRGAGGGESLMLNGHLDIDPLPSGLTRDPFSPAAEGSMFFGAGIGNMKAGRRFDDSPRPPPRSERGFPRRGELILACVVGELQGGAGHRAPDPLGRQADAAIVTEPHGASNVVTKHGGVMQLAIHVLGRTAHISRKEQGVNAILKASKVAQMLETMKLEGKPDPELPASPHPERRQHHRRPRPERRAPRTEHRSRFRDALRRYPFHRRYDSIEHRRGPEARARRARARGPRSRSTRSSFR